MRFQTEKVWVQKSYSDQRKEWNVSLVCLHSQGISLLSRKQVEELVMKYINSATISSNGWVEILRCQRPRGSGRPYYFGLEIPVQVLLSFYSAYFQ